MRRVPLLTRTLLVFLPSLVWGGVVTNSGDPLRTGWYPDQASLSPQLVSSASFQARFQTTLNGQIYAQPLVANGDSLFIATESNWIYRLDPENGRIQWARNLGTPWNAADLACPDLAPTVGITGTPAIDESTNTAYFFAKTYESGTSGPAAWDMHAVDLYGGAERAGFPVRIQGNANNNPAQQFRPTLQLQRTGLLLMNGVVYAGFGSHCDTLPWQGWVVGVSTSGVIKAMWVTTSGTDGSGGGIWQAGTGLVSDGSGQILFATGNGNSPSTPIPGTTPPADLGDCVVRLAVQSNGTLQAVDFFAPYNAADMDDTDLDLSACSPTGLPAPYFGTVALPHLAVQAGKEGYVYLLNRDNLGGTQQGPGGTDNVVQRVGPFGGVWSRPAVWPGDGGWVYIPTASPGFSPEGSTGFLEVYQYGVDGVGRPTLTNVASSADSFGFGASAPVVTSNGTTSGSALLWVVWCADPSGANAQLRAYDPVPVGVTAALRYAAPIGNRSKFNPPGVGLGRVYVANRDGVVISFGPPVIHLDVSRAPSTGSVHLQWSGGNPPYTLLRAEDPAFRVNPVNLVNHQNVTSFDDPVLNDGHSYYYQVR